MIKVILFDLSKTLLFAKDPNYHGDLNPFHKQLIDHNPNYPFWDYFYLDLDMLELVKKLKTIYQTAMFTSGSIQNHPSLIQKLIQLFNPIISAQDIGFSKKERQAYQKIAQILKTKPSEILFIDDSLKNIEVAAQAGYATIGFENLEKLKIELKKVLK